jgi:hypothetical protein
MVLLNILSYAAAIAAFLFVTLSLGEVIQLRGSCVFTYGLVYLASGLLWLAEVIEENSKFAKTIGVRAVYVSL